MDHPRPLFRLVLVFFKQTTIQCLQQINVKNVHPVNFAGIQTHDLQNMILLPLPLDTVKCVILNGPDPASLGLFSFFQQDKTNIAQI